MSENCADKVVNIKVLGVGGAGNNVVDRMISGGIGGSEFVVVNTDLQALNKSKCENKVLIGEKLTGGTGTGAAPIIADLAHDAGILTVGIVTKPFRFEGANRRKQAEAGIASLSDKVDSLIIIPNDHLKYATDQKITFANAFGIANDVLKRAVSAIYGYTTAKGTRSDENGMPDVKKRGTHNEFKKTGENAGSRNGHGKGC